MLAKDVRQMDMLFEPVEADLGAAIADTATYVGKEPMVRTHAQTRKPASTLRRMPLSTGTSKGHSPALARVQQILHGPRLQPKLTVGPPDDAHEREADRMADEVMRMPEGAEGLHRVCAECKGELQRQPEEEPEKQMPGGRPSRMSLKPVGPSRRHVRAPGERRRGLLDSDVESTVRALKGGGRPLPAEVRSLFESRFGQDFSAVRLHTGVAAAEVASVLRARAFTTGDQIAFGEGQYAPASEEGQGLLAHELTHVVQQGCTRSTPNIQRLVEANCDSKTPLPISGSITVPASGSDFTGEAFSGTFSGTKGRSVTITASASYVGPVPPGVVGRENFSVLLRQCGAYDSDVGTMVRGIIDGAAVTFTRTLPGPGVVIGRDDYYLRLGNANTRQDIIVAFSVS